MFKLIILICFQTVAHFKDKNDALQWAGSVSLSGQELAEIKDASILEIISKSIKVQVHQAFRNFTDIGIIIKSE